MLLIYTGNGKGKTSATTGQAIRAYGRGIPIAFGQFMKRADQAGEQKVLESLLGERFMVNGAGFFRDPSEFPEHREAAKKVLEWALHQLDSVKMLLLDEALYALNAHLITEDELRMLITKANEKQADLVLSGRGLPDWLKETADLVTEMLEVKHPFATGVKARKGIEF